MARFAAGAVPKVAIAYAGTYAAGMAAHAYPEMLALVATGRLRPDLLVTRRLTLAQAGEALPAMGGPGSPPGVTVLLPGG